jgi:hypothetical protein
MPGPFALRVLWGSALRAATRKISSPLSHPRRDVARPHLDRAEHEPGAKAPLPKGLFAGLFVPHQANAAQRAGLFASAGEIDRDFGFKDVVHINCGKGAAQKYRYEEGEIDFLVIHVIPENMFFILPSEALKARVGLSIPSVRRGDTGRCKRYHDRWDLLFGTPAERTLDQDGEFGLRR